MYDGLEVHLAGWPDTIAREVAACGAANAEYLHACAAAGEFPRDVYTDMGHRGWTGTLVPVEHGGRDGGVAEYCIVEEEVSRHGLVSPQTAAQGQLWLLAWGTPEQQTRYLPGLASGEIVFSEAISEPGAGSSLKAMRARARRKGSGWVIDGAKTHVNLGHHCDLTIVYAMAGDEGLTAFLVDVPTPGLSSAVSEPVGLRLIPTADMVFDDVYVPDSAVLGEVGRGLDTFLTTFNVSRLGNASELIGFARRALTDAVDYASTRRVGDSYVTDFQGIQWTVADAYTALQGAALARNHAANLADRDADIALATTLAKKLAIDAAERAVGDCFSLVGGHGLYRDRNYAQLLMDVKVLRVAGGSLEVLRNFVARNVLRSPDLGGLR